VCVAGCGCLWEGVKEGSVHACVINYVVQQQSEKRGAVVVCGDERRQCAYACYDLCCSANVREARCGCWLWG
jgi:hypothetical protein